MTVAREQTKRRRFRARLGFEPTHSNRSMQGQLEQFKKRPGVHVVAVHPAAIHRKAVESMATPMQKHKQHRSEEEQIAKVAKLAEAQVARSKQEKKPGFFKKVWNKLKGA